jgi:hypothetical protein
MGFRFWIPFRVKSEGKKFNIRSCISTTHTVGYSYVFMEPPAEPVFIFPWLQLSYLCHKSCTLYNKSLNVTIWYQFHLFHKFSFADVPRVPSNKQLQMNNIVSPALGPINPFLHTSSRQEKLHLYPPPPSTRVPLPDGTTTYRPRLIPLLHIHCCPLQDQARPGAFCRSGRPASPWHPGKTPASTLPHPLYFLLLVGGLFRWPRRVPLDGRTGWTDTHTQPRIQTDIYTCTHWDARATNALTHARIDTHKHRPAHTLPHT